MTTATTSEKPQYGKGGLSEYDILSAVQSICAGYPFEDKADEIAQAYIDHANAEYGFIRRPFTPELFGVFVGAGISIGDHKGLRKRIRRAFHYLRGLAYYRR